MEDKETLEIFKKIYLSEVIFKQHYDSMNMINIVAVILQTITIFLGILIREIFNISSTWMIFTAIFLLIMQMVSTKILSRNWEEAKRRLETYHRITEDTDLEQESK